MKSITIANDGTATVVEPTDSSWYKYECESNVAYGTDHKSCIWANAKTLDNSQFVWIPRYAYKIATSHTSTPCEIDVKFLIGTTDKYMKNGVETALPADYIVHPAFTFGTDKLTGIWVAKYEASNNGGKIKITPGVNSLSNWKSINLADIFDNCFTMATDSTYGFTGLTNGNTHMMKNIEWGAAAYLAHSKYGRNGNEITINNSSSCITGSAGNSVSAATDVGTTAYNTTGGYLASTTGNISGIYDMSGGAYECVAANFNSTLGNSVSFAKNFDIVWNSSTEKVKYFDIYDGYNDKIKGDAVYETSNVQFESTSWFGDGDSFIGLSDPWLARGGFYSDGANAGSFFFYDDGAGDIFGQSVFRPVVSAL